MRIVSWNLHGIMMEFHCASSPRSSETWCKISKDCARVIDLDCKISVEILFENDEIGVEHSFVTFNDGNKEAVMAVYKYKDGKVISLETGATKISK